MERKKIHIEYLLKSTAESILWNAISTPSGLEGWFAEKITIDGHTVTFNWGGEDVRIAEITATRAYSFIRFKWLDAEYPREYFELRMNYNELTNEYNLEITDFGDEGEEEDLKELWNSQVETLRRKCGF